ncbi:anaphase-promoting complex, cyclosome, subunit 4-domain-containing protein [Mycotypha africana]|uniref:anaphase-promoting complex, cyclosome, subunit 4-domain-containing protein n=1 Tax=Mycotypha africana TaxID=64632 RepID=UPI002300B4CF|nr:anaphase-promoting complex, cyclosome, subunit 4-domain-containing protein [Mycotypha africana]KAI8967143.1 anaphase-promoting complex, cyclosome, subunit 4-domain-containing protein [Mycotypha africana]
MAEEVSDCITNVEESAMAMPSVEFIGALATGMVTEPLHHFFTEILNIRGIKQWEDDMNYGHVNSLIVASQYILPACDRMLIELSKLYGYSSWTQRYGDLLNEKEVNNCITYVRDLISVMYRFIRSLQNVMKIFAAFISWVSVVWEKVVTSESESSKIDYICDEPELVLQYLQTSFTEDPFKHYFASTPDTSNTNLVQLVNKLTNGCHDMLSKPSTTISTKIRHLSTLSLLGLPLTDTFSLASHLSQDNIIYYAMSTQIPTSQVILLRNHIRKKRIEYACFAVDGLLTDAQFFDKHELGVVVEIDQENSCLQSYSLERLPYDVFGQHEIVSRTVEVKHRSLCLKKKVIDRFLTFFHSPAFSKSTTCKNDQGQDGLQRFTA